MEVDKFMEYIRLIKADYDRMRVSGFAKLRP